MFGKSSLVRCWQLGTTIIAFSLLFTMLEAGGSEIDSSKRDPGHLLYRERSLFPFRLAQRQRRIALVIGNGDYKVGEKLKNPANDARDIAKALQELGFEVTLLVDVNKRRSDEAIEKFSRELSNGGAGVFYYAGHGMQVDGENYLIPLKANISREQDVQYEGIPLGRILGAMEDADNHVNIVLIDACRDNPYSRGWRSRTRGLASVGSARGTLISFSTGPGNVAFDGDGHNSPYTTSLLEHIKTPGLPVELMFKEVRKSVEAVTNQQQSPWEQTNLIGEFAFNPTQPASAPRTLPPPAPSSRPTSTSVPVGSNTTPPAPSSRATSTAAPILIPTAPSSRVTHSRVTHRREVVVLDPTSGRTINVPESSSSTTIDSPTTRPQSPSGLSSVLVPSGNRQPSSVTELSQLQHNLLRYMSRFPNPKESIFDKLLCKGYYIEQNDISLLQEVSRQYYQSRARNIIRAVDTQIFDALVRFEDVVLRFQQNNGLSTDRDSRTLVRTLSFLYHGSCS